MLKLCHLSDLHICSENGRENIKKTEKILNYAMDLGFDHLVITGDIVHNPKAADFKIARDILRDFGLLKSERLSLVIGNHEIYGGIHFLKEILSFPHKSCRINYDTQVARFRDYFPEAFENIYSEDNERIFPYAKIIGDTVILGLNSTAQYSLLFNPLASSGIISKDHLEALSSLLRLPVCKGREKVMLTHHHFCEFRNLDAGVDMFKLRRLEFETLKLHGKTRLLELLRRYKVRTILHGHVHKSLDYKQKGINFSNAGGSVDSWNPHMISVNFITISGERVRTNIHTFSTNLESIFEGIYSGDVWPEFVG